MNPIQQLETKNKNLYKRLMELEEQRETLLKNIENNVNKFRQNIINVNKFRQNIINDLAYECPTGLTYYLKYKFGNPAKISK